MAVNSISSGNTHVPMAQVQPQVHSERVAERENDNDRDDAGSAAAVNVAPKPTVNTSGQTIGSIISVQA